MFYWLTILFGLLVSKKKHGVLNCLPMNSESVLTNSQMTTDIFTQKGAWPWRRRKVPGWVDLMYTKHFHPSRQKCNTYQNKDSSTLKPQSSEDARREYG